MTTDRIEINPAVLQGKPVVRGTRVPVEDILRKLSEGSTEADLLAAYPRLTRDDIHAVLRYAADSVARLMEEARTSGPGLDDREADLLADEAKHASRRVRR